MLGTTILYVVRAFAISFCLALIYVPLGQFPEGIKTLYYPQYNFLPTLSPPVITRPPPPLPFAHRDGWCWSEGRAGSEQTVWTGGRPKLHQNYIPSAEPREGLLYSATSNTCVYMYVSSFLLHIYYIHVNFVRLL